MSTTSPSPLHTLIHKDPSFGYDAWLNQETVAVDFSATAPVYHGADTLAADISELPAGLNMYASYIDNFGGWPQLVTRFSKTSAFLLSITIFGGAARCADVEPGAMIATDLPHWLDVVAISNALSVPWVYTNAANMAACNAQISDRKVIRWSAHYGHGAHICGPGTCGWPQADWTQWADVGPSGQNIDQSIGRLLPSTPKPAGPHGTARFEGSVNLATGKWTIHGLPGVVHFAGEHKFASAEIQVDVGGGGGDWRIHGMDWNAPPLGGP